MNQYFKYIVILTVSMMPTFAANASSCCGNSFFSNSDFRVGYTYRNDNLDYKLVQTCGSVTESVEDSFDSMTIHQISAFGDFETFDKVLVKGRFNYGWLVDGDSETTTKIDEYTTTRKGCVEGSNVWDASLGLGVISPVDYCGYRLMPLLGYSWHYQDINAVNHFIKIDTLTDLTNGLCIRGLEEEYSAWWCGPWIGFDMNFDYYSSWDIFVGLELHWAGYEGEFKSGGIAINNVSLDARQRKDCGYGYGYVCNAGFDVELCGGWDGFILGSYQMWELECGRGKNIDNEIFDINSLTWDSFQITVGVRLDF